MVRQASALHLAKKKMSGPPAKIPLVMASRQLSPQAAWKPYKCATNATQYDSATDTYYQQQPITKVHGDSPLFIMPWLTGTALEVVGSWAAPLRRSPGRVDCLLAGGPCHPLYKKKCDRTVTDQPQIQPPHAPSSPP